MDLLCFAKVGEYGLLRGLLAACSRHTAVRPRFPGTRRAASRRPRRQRRHKFRQSHQKPSRPKAIAIASTLQPAFLHSDRSIKAHIASSSGSSFFKGWHSAPGYDPGATSQLSDAMRTLFPPIAPGDVTVPLGQSWSSQVIGARCRTRPSSLCALATGHFMRRGAPNHLSPISTNSPAGTTDASPTHRPHRGAHHRPTRGSRRSLTIR